MGDVKTVVVCGQAHPAIKGLVCERHVGHRDRHQRIIMLSHDRRVVTEWEIYEIRKEDSCRSR